MGTPIYNLSQFRHLESFMCLVSDAITMCSAATSTPMFRIPHESTPGFLFQSSRLHFAQQKFYGYRLPWIP